MTEDTKKKTVWGYASSPEPEGGWTGAFDTKELAVEAALAEGMDEVWVQEGEYPEAADFVDSDDVVDAIFNRCGDEVRIPDSVDEPVIIGDQAQDELQTFLEGWAAKHLEFNFWQPLGDPELAVSEEE